jgi:hypothetical protein
MATVFEIVAPAIQPLIFFSRLIISIAARVAS